MALINSAIKNTGVTKTGNQSINTTSSTNNTKTNKKITNGLTNKDGQDSDDNSDDGEVAKGDGKQGAESTVNSKKQDAKTTVKNGTLVSDVDKSKDPSAPRGGPEGYAAHSPLGFNQDPAAGYTGVPGLPPGAALGGLSGLGSLFGGAGGPPPGGGSGGGGSGGGAGKINPPQASRPQERKTPEKETKPKEQFSEKALEVDKNTSVTNTEKKELAEKYGASNSFSKEYNDSILPKNAKDRIDTNSPLSMPKNFAMNQAYAANDKNGDKHDPKLSELMQNYHDVRNQSIAKAKEIGEKLTDGGDLKKIDTGYNSREFLIGTDNPPVSGLKPIDDAYKAINQHLEEKGYTHTSEAGETRPLKADDLLQDPEALKNSTINEKPVEAEKPIDGSGRSEQASFEPKLNLDMDILDNDELASIDYNDDLEIEDIGLDWDLDEELEDLDLEIA